jgi:hypothetical protein
MAEPPVTTSVDSAMEAAPVLRPSVTWAVIVALVMLAVIRSAVATRTDGFTIDDAYHITAGVSYVKLRDFRLNAEHPPLVKLWVGAALARDFQLPPLPPLSDKFAEREFNVSVVFLENDPDRVRAPARGYVDFEWLADAFPGLGRFARARQRRRVGHGRLPGYRPDRGGAPSSCAHGSSCGTAGSDGDSLCGSGFSFSTMARRSLGRTRTGVNARRKALGIDCLGCDRHVCCCDGPISENRLKDNKSSENARRNLCHRARCFSRAVGTLWIPLL